MYKKKKNINENAIDKRLQCFCRDILVLNKNICLAISKKFVENSNGSLNQEVVGLPVIACSCPVEDLIIPSGYRITNNCYLSTCCKKEPLTKIVYSKMKFTDGNVGEKTIKNFYLDIDDNFIKSKEYSQV